MELGGREGRACAKMTSIINVGSMTGEQLGMQDVRAQSLPYMVCGLGMRLLNQFS